MLIRVLRWMGIVPAFSAVHVFARSSEIVDTAYVANALKNGSIVWDVREAAAYEAGHIAGADQYWSDHQRAERSGQGGLAAHPARSRRLLGHAGIDLPNREVIVYGRAGDPTAYFGLLTVRYFGGGSRQGLSRAVLTNGRLPG